MGAVTTANSDTVPEGDVISQAPVGDSSVERFDGGSGGIVRLVQ